MKKANLWELVNKEAGNVIKSIENGEVKTRKDYNDYLESVYHWNIANAIETVVGAYLAVNGIEIPWNDEENA